MPVTTYDELKTEVYNWLGDDDVIDFIPSFIATCEANMRRNLRVDELMVRDTGVTVPSGTREIDLTTDLTSSYQDMNFVRIARPSGEGLLYYPPLIQTTMEDLSRQSVDHDWRPQFFNITGQVLEFEVALDRDYDMDFFYWKEFDALSDTNASNEILANYPDLYLWGSLASSAPFIDNDERIQTWSGLYNGALADIHRMDVKRKMAGPQRPKTRGKPPRNRY